MAAAGEGGGGGIGRYVGGYNGSRGIKIGTPVPPSKNLQRQTSNPARCAWLPYAYRMPLPTFREGNLLCDLI